MPSTTNLRPEPSELRSGRVMRMVWENLLFAHWPVSASALAPLLPKGLEVDTYDGRAWIAVVPFFMTGVGAAMLPGWMGRRFAELNIRTYVRAGGRAGVWFFSLDAESPLAVRLARRFYHLPYFDADMTVETSAEGVEYRSRRTHRDAPPAALHVRYKPLAGVFQAVPGSIEEFLVERYRLFVADPRGRILRCEIAHAPWPIQRAQAEFGQQTMLDAIGLPIDEPPALLHFAARIDVRAGLLAAA
jgi:uncharacterized protein